MYLAPGKSAWSRVLVVGLSASAAWVLLAAVLQAAGQCCNTESLCCYRNTRVCRLAARAEHSWQTESKAWCWVLQPRLVPAQHCSLASPGGLIHGLPAAVPGPAVSCPGSMWVGVKAHPHCGGSHHVWLVRGPSSCCLCLVVDFLVCTGDNRSKWTALQVTVI